MRKIIAVCGVPGTGKTSLFRKFMADYKWQRREEAKLVTSEYSEQLNLHILGKYDEGEVFAGTDKLSMAVWPEIEKWAVTTDANIMFEGDRLTGQKSYDFFSSLPDTEFHIVVISADKATLQSRYDERGSNQPEQFLKSKDTKIGNILSNFDYMDFIAEFANENLDDQKKILDFISSKLL
jgi:broad-specificity NMP kinase